jgi:hypothetical protein
MAAFLQSVLVVFGLAGSVVEAASGEIENAAAAMKYAHGGAHVEPGCK